MYRVTIDQEEVHVFRDSVFLYTLPIEDYKELEQARDLVFSVAESHRSADEIRLDALVGLVMEQEPDVLTELLDPWTIGTYYRIGEYFVYNGTLYRTLQAHTSQADWLPDRTPSLYVLANNTSIDPVDITDWVRPTGAHDAYLIGDKVRFEDKFYESLLNGNTYSPTEYPQGWKEIE